MTDLDLVADRIVRLLIFIESASPRLVRDIEDPASDGLHQDIVDLAEPLHEEAIPFAVLFKVRHPNE